MTLRRTQRLLPMLILVPLAILATTVSGATSAEKRWSPERWKKTLSQEKYDAVVSSTHFLEAADGTQLSLTLHLPAGLPKDAKIATLLQITPYQPIDQGLSRFGTYDDYFFFVLRGAAYVEADARGTGGSEGCLDFGGGADRSDAQVFADWIREQPWSNGDIVTDGVSHPGMGSLVAHTSVPHLTGALAHAPVVSYYRDEWYDGAKFEDQFNGPAYQGIEALPPIYTDPQALQAQAAPCTGKTTLDFTPVEGRFGKLWKERDLARHLPDERIPVLLTQGFIDQNVHPDHVQSYWDALPKSYPKWVIWGWWYHGYPDMQGHPFARFEDMRHRWLDALLFGTDNGLFAEPRVLVEDSKGNWHEGEQWPLEPSTSVTFYPGEDGSLGKRPTAAGSVSYSDAVGAERGSWDGASVVFATEPLDKDMMVNGAPDVTLYASSSESATKWVAYLLDEAPDGTWQRVSHGYVDSHIYDGKSQWEAMEPGKIYRWKIDLMPTAVVLDKGHRLVLVIASQDSRNLSIRRRFAACFEDYRGGCYNPSGIVPGETLGRGENTVKVGPGATRVRVDWVPPAKTQKPPWE